MKTKELIEHFEKKYNKKINEIELFIDWINISQSKNPYLTEEFMRKFKYKVWWYCVFNHQILSGAFIEEIIKEFKDGIKPTWLSRKNKINWLKYKLKSGKISNEQYLKELIKC